jgi:gas vesicle protein
MSTDIILCRNGCGKSFKTIPNRYKHEIAFCSTIKNKYTKIEDELEKKSIELSNVKEKYDKLKDDYDKLKEEYDEMKEELKKVHDQNFTMLHATLQANVKITEKASDVNVHSMSALKYLSKHITNVPVLKHRKDEIFGQIENSHSKSITSTEYIINKFSSGNFPKWIGSLIATVYKGENIDLMSMYCTDTTRLTYIIGAIINGTKQAKWITDDSGLKVNELVIVPALNLIYNMMDTYIMEEIDISKMDKYQMDEVFNARKNALQLMNEIKKEKINMIILKKIASELHFKRFLPQLDDTKDTKNIKLLKDTVLY